MLVDIYSDGATVGHNGKLGTVKRVGVGISIPSLKYGGGIQLDGISNNEAEFKALILAMEIALKKGIRRARFNLDSKIVVNRAKGRRPKGKHHNERMNAFQDKVAELARQFQVVEFRWIPRERNWLADYYSKLASNDGALKDFGKRLEGLGDYLHGQGHDSLAEILSNKNGE